MKCFPSIKPHLTDAVLTALIQNRLSDKKALDLASDLTSIAQLKVSHSHLESIDL